MAANPKALKIAPDQGQQEKTINKSVQEVLNDSYMQSLILSCLAIAADSDEKKMPELVKFIREHPNIFDGDSLEMVSLRGMIIDDMTSGRGSSHVLHQECVKKAEDLTGENPSPVERLLVERIILTWLHLLWAETQYRLLMKEQTHLIKHAEFLERTIARAHARYIRAIESLERIRFLYSARRVAEAKADLLEARARKVNGRTLRAHT